MKFVFFSFPTNSSAFTITITDQIRLKYLKCIRKSICNSLIFVIIPQFNAKCFRIVCPYPIEFHYISKIYTKSCLLTLLLIFGFSPIIGCCVMFLSISLKSSWNKELNAFVFVSLTNRFIE